MDYNFREIEARWQKYWAEKQTFKAEEDPSKPKFYVLDMFPYPSGAGLHVGHPLGYIASDIVSRYKRLKGFNVLHPMGYDAFGLPAEQYAIQTGQHPEVTTDVNIARYRSQLDRIGFSYDWDRSFRTCDPDYFKWTQWAFLQMFGSYYCNSCRSARPIEELVAAFEKSGTEGLDVACSQELSFTAQQWNAYSEKEKSDILMNYRIAYQGETSVNWCPGLGTVLANDEVKDGLSVRGGFPVVQRKMTQWQLRVSAYAGRLLDSLDSLDWTDSLKEMQRNWIGKLAPESDLARELTASSQKTAVEEYIAAVAKKTERERIAETKSVTGVFSGSYGINPLTGEKVPVWISEYVLAGYGTGAIMAVPAHDSRDYAFAKKFGLPIVPIIEGCDVSEQIFDAKEGIMCNSGFLDGMTVKEAIPAAMDYVEAHGLGHRKTNYRLRDAIFSRQRYWGEPFPIYYKDGIPTPVPEDSLPVTLPEIDQYKPTEDGQPPLARAKDWTFGGYPLETSTMGGTEHATGHLIYSRFWNKFLFDKGYVCEDEPFRKLINQGMIQGRSNFVYRVVGTNTFVSAGLKKDYQTQEIHVDINLVRNDRLDIEAFKAWRPEYADAQFILEDGQYICGWAVEKMSKSMYNVVNPDDICDTYGADTLRLYEMFLGPLEQSKPWDTKGIDGVHRFLRKFWRLFYDGDQWIVSDEQPSSEDLKTLHRLIAKEQSDIEGFSFNTTVSAFMIAVNDLTDRKVSKRGILEPMVIMLSPFAPHIAEQLWHDLGHADSVTYASFPEYREEYTVENNCTYAVSFNGKMRFTTDLPKSMGQAQVQDAVLAMDQAKKYTAGLTVVKVIVVPGKIVNVVVK